jgi:hypothetical protein
VSTCGRRISIKIHVNIITSLTPALKGALEGVWSKNGKKVPIDMGVLRVRYVDQDEGKVYGLG